MRVEWSKMLLNLPLGLVWVGLALLFFWVALVSYFLWRVIDHYQRLTRGVTKKELKNVLEGLLAEVDQQREDLKELTGKIKRLDEESRSHVQKVGLVRFNPFSETGGDQSFVAAILDDHDDGLVISSLHSRQATRIYAKPIKGGRPVGYRLSREEEEAVSKAIKK